MFVALRVPTDAQEDLDSFLAPRYEAFGISWVPPEHWHLTLAFLPEVPDRVLEPLTERLAWVAERRSPIPMRLAGAGAFPDPFAARALFLAPDHDDDAHRELARLASGCRTAATTSGVAVDGARFVPHVTLARSRRPVVATTWIRVMDTYRGPEWVAEEIVVVASHLREPQRSPRRHEVLASLALRGSDG